MVVGSSPANLYSGLLQTCGVLSLLFAILAYKRALEPLYASVPTQAYLYHAIISASALGFFFSCSLRKAAVIYSALLAAAPHTAYWVASYSARWRNPVYGPALTHTLVLVPVISTGVQLLCSTRTDSSLLLIFFYCVVFPSVIWYLMPSLSSIPSTDIFLALAIMISVASASAELLGAPPRPAKRNVRIPQLDLLLHLILCASIVTVSFNYAPTLHSRFHGIASEPYTDPTNLVRILSSVQSNTGVIVVGEIFAPFDPEGKHCSGLRYLRAAHSILGGAWISNRPVTNDNRCTIIDAQDARLGDSIYPAFTLQEAVRLVNSTERGDDWSNSDALIIGLGAGIAPTALRLHGLSTTILEIDPAVYHAARTFFGFPDPGKGRVFLEDGREWVAKRRRTIQKKEEGLFDVIIHDCFSGGGLPAHIFTLEFWNELKDLLEPDGVVAINFAGTPGSKSARAITSTLLAAFSQCRAYFYAEEIHSKDQLKDAFLNVVFFCSKLPSTIPITFRTAREEDYLGSNSRKSVLGSWINRELDLRVILDTGRTGPDTEMLVLTDEFNPLGEWQREEAAQHWKLIRDVFPDALWELF